LTWIGQGRGAVRRSRSVAQHQRPARQALEPSDREAAPEDQGGPEAPGDGGCRRGRVSMNGPENFWRLAVLDALPELPAINEGGAKAEDREWAWSRREGGC